MPSFYLNDTLHVLIELAQISDIDEIVALEHRAFPYPWSRKVLMAEIDGESFSYVYVARLINEKGLPDKIIGHHIFWLVADEVHVLNIAVDPEYHGNGLGRILMDFAADFGRERGARIMLLEVRVSNLPAQALYHKLGFQQVGLRKKYYADNREDAYAMTKDL